MRIETVRKGSTIILRPRGMLVGIDADQLQSQVTQHLAAKETTIVLDIEGILFADSHGLEILVDLAETMIRSGRVLKLVGNNPKLSEVLDLTDLASLFQLSGDVTAAVEASA